LCVRPEIGEGRCEGAPYIVAAFEMKSVDIRAIADDETYTTWGMLCPGMVFNPDSRVGKLLYSKAIHHPANEGENYIFGKPR